MDAGLVLAALGCVALRGVLAPHPTLFAVVAAVIVGTIVQRVPFLTRSPAPEVPATTRSVLASPAVTTVAQVASSS